jgi:hypothetical protein
MNDKLHILEKEEREHEISPDCWCGPYLYFTNPKGEQIWVHRNGPFDPGPSTDVLELAFRINMESTYE